MPKIGKQFRMSEATIEKLAWLKERYGTETEVVAIAIEKLFEEETKIVARTKKSDGSNIKP